MKIDENLLDYLSNLSRLKLNDDEKKILMPQLQEIVGYVEKLSEVNIEGIEPMAHSIDMQNVFREDISKKIYRKEDILKNAPQTDGDFFEVPKII